MNAKKTEKRINKGYKVKNSFYEKAMKRAKKEGGSLANIVENVVMAYSYGLDIRAVKTESGRIHALDIISEGFYTDLTNIAK